MRHTTAFLILTILAVAFLPGYLAAQEVPPPPCCNRDSLSAPDTTSQDAAYTLPQVAISDAALSAVGMSRSQFLDSLAAALFSGAESTYSLLIPIYTEAAAGGGETSVPLSLVAVDRSLVTDEIIDLLEFVLISDGEITVVVVFDSTAVD